MGQNFQQEKKQVKSCQRKGDFRKLGETNYLAGAWWMFNSHSLLHSGSHCALIKAELRKKTGVRKYQVQSPGQPTPATHKCSQARLGHPVQYQHQDKSRVTAVLGRFCPWAHRGPPGAERWSHKGRQRRPTTTVLYGHIVPPPHTTGTQTPPNLNTTGYTWSHKHTHHGNRTVTIAVIGTPLTPIPTATLHGDTATTKNWHAPYTNNIKNTYAMGKHNHRSHS